MSALIPPLSGQISVTSAFGEDRGWYSHGGIDLALKQEPVRGKPVRAPAAGVVAAIWTTAETNGGFPYGNAIALQTDDGAIWRFLHFDEPPSLSVGASVAAGDTLGLAGSTGQSTGPHVHMDVTLDGSISTATFNVAGRRVDPLRVFADSYADVAGIDAEAFRDQISAASSWNPWYDENPPATNTGAEGVAAIDPQIHPSMRERTFDPFDSLEFAAGNMADGLRRREGDLAEALADYRSGPLSADHDRDDGFRYAAEVLTGRDIAPGVRPNPPPQPVPRELLEELDRRTRRYGRSVRVEIGRRTAEESPIGPTGPVEREGSRLEVEDLRIEFEIRSESQPDSAPSNVRIYNLARDSVRQIRSGAAMQLTAGYDSAVGLLHEGEILRVEDERAGLDRVTTLSLGIPRATQVAGSIFTGSYQGVVSLRTVVAKIVEAMQLVLGDSRDVPDRPVESYVYHGKAADALTALLRPRGIEWWVENQLVHFTAQGRAYPEPEKLISEGAGLVGSPTLTDNGVRVKMLLDHGVRLAQPVRIESEVVTGPFKVTAITHRGDNREGDFATELECVAA